MTNVYEPEDSSEPVAAIVKVATPSDEATVDVIFRDQQMISKNNLDVLVKTYIAVARLDKDKDAGAAFAITGVEKKKAKLETIYKTVDGKTRILGSAHREPPRQTGKKISCVTYSMVPVTEDALESLRKSVIARADQIRHAEVIR